MTKVIESTTAIIAADLHLLKKPGMWASRDEIAGDDEFALAQLVDLCLAEKADLYLLGDILDSVTTLPRPLVLAKRHLTKLLEAGLKVRYIQGQHEIVVQAHYDNYPWLSLIDETQHIHEVEFEFLGFKAFALDYFPKLLETIRFNQVPPGTEVLFLHGTVDSVMPVNYHFSAALLPKSVKWVFAGDWHEAAKVSIANGGTLFYPGSTYLTEVNSPIDKHAYRVVRYKDALKVEDVQLKTRVVVKASEILNKGSEVDLAVFFGKFDMSGLPDALKRPLILVNVPLSAEQYVKFSEHAHLYTTSGANPGMPVQVEIDRIDKLSDEEILMRYIDRKEQASEFEFILDVIQHPVGDALERVRQRLGVKPSELVTATPYQGGQVDAQIVI